MASAVAERLESIQTRGGIKARDVAQLLDTSPQTVSRWQTGKAEPQTDGLKRLLLLEYLIGELAEFYDPQEARMWLFAPHRLLHGDTPADRIQRGQPEDVQALIAQIRDGAFV